MFSSQGVVVPTRDVRRGPGARGNCRFSDATARNRPASSAGLDAPGLRPEAASKESSMEFRRRAANPRGRTPRPNAGASLRDAPARPRSRERHVANPPPPTRDLPHAAPPASFVRPGATARSPARVPSHLPVRAIFVAVGAFTSVGSGVSFLAADRRRITRLSGRASCCCKPGDADDPAAGGCHDCPQIALPVVSASLCPLLVPGARRPPPTTSIPSCQRRPSPG